MNKKLISFAIPSYNSEEYMEKCIESILPGGDEVEIIIVDDGSSDSTGEIADRYEREYPNIVTAVHQPNGGHGEAVNAGLKAATGKYFKVVDSDDWVDEEGYKKVLDTLHGLESRGASVDMFLTNFVYDKVSENHQRRMLLSVLFPSDRIITWEEMKHNVKGFFILMHSVIYRTQMLRDCKLSLPKHTFYVDNIFVYVPMRYVRTIYYLNETFYHYYIGREGQSVQEEIMVKRIDQQLKVNRIMIDAFDPFEIQNKKQRKYLLSYLEMITVISCMLGAVSNTPENDAKIHELWDYMKETNPKMYKKVRFGILGNAAHYRTFLGKKFFLFCYHLSQKLVGFN
ncbi:MAG: glycosyltransferase [Lachnospiraceae bacterium]|nr:glycosyltransferase [Lachnospiraceae bacterium]